MNLTLYTGNMQATFDRSNRLCFPALISNLLTKGGNSEVFIFYNLENKKVAFKRADDLDIEDRQICSKISREQNKPARIIIPKPLRDLLGIDGKKMVGSKIPLEFIVDETGKKLLMILADFSTTTDQK